MDEVTIFYVGDLFCIHLDTKYANFQEKISAEISGRKFQTLHCSNVLRLLTTEQVIEVLYLQGVQLYGTVQDRPATLDFSLRIFKVMGHTQTII